MNEEDNDGFGGVGGVKGGNDYTFSMSERVEFSGLVEEKMVEAVVVCVKENGFLIC